MASPNIKKMEGASLIDCAMIVIEPDDGSDGIAFTSASKLGVEMQSENKDGVKNTIKGEVKAQKPETVTHTGHTLTLTDTTMIMEFLPILQGGELTMDEDGITPVKYVPPLSGKNEGKTFKLKAYTAIMKGSSTIGYGCTTYYGCKGTPVVWNLEDDVFQSNEYTINSTPGAGEPTHTWERVDKLPTFEASLGTLTVQSAAGSTTGKTKLTVTPSKSGSNIYMVKTGSSVDMPAYDAVCSSDYQAWDGTSDLTATTGQKILVVECTSDKKARKAGIATVTSKT